MRPHLLPSYNVCFFIFLFVLGSTSTNSHGLTQGNDNVTSYTKTWNTVYRPFKGEGTVVEGADFVGGHLLGSVGVIIGIPLGVVGATITQLTLDDPNKGYNYTLQASSDSFSIVGKYLFGLPVYTIKKIFYDLPLKLIETDITYNQRTKKNGLGKIRH